LLGFGTIKKNPPTFEKIPLATSERSEQCRVSCFTLIAHTK
jgi:hypothetical protein